MCCPLRPLGAVLCLLAIAHGRVLLEEKQQCDKQPQWSYQACYAATSTPPPPTAPPVQAADGPASKAPPECLPTRWGGAPPPGTEPDNCTQANPFVSSDVMPPLVMSAQGSAVSGGRTLGFRAGGAQDVETFRENIKQNYLPMPTDMTYEGLIKDYYFDTNSPNATVEPCTQLFCPRYSLAASPDPMLPSASGATARTAASAPESEIYLAVGLDSGIQESDFKRKRLNLVVVVDVSGSMGETWSSYYYDSLGQQKNLTEAEQNSTKIDVAKEVLKGILDQLHPDDYLSIVLFSDGSCAPKSMGPVSCADIPFLKTQIDRDLAATSGTALSKGLDLAADELAGCQRCKESSMADSETRIMLITDQEPNSGDYTTEGLEARLKKFADSNVFITIIGVGLDFNTELTEAISKVRGALYFSVHSPGEFQRRLVQDFDYAVTPLVFDLTLAVDSGSLTAGTDDSGWRILHVFGSPNPNQTVLTSDGTVMKIDTLFPSPKTEEGVKGGVVLLRLSPPQSGTRPLQLTASYTDREGKQFSSKRTVAIPPEVAAAAAQGSQGAGAKAAPTTLYQSSGVRKAVLLARYTNMLQGWLVDEWSRIEPNKTVVVNATLCSAFPADYCPSVDARATYDVTQGPGGTCQLESWLEPGACLLPVPIPVLVQLGQWERTSQNLTASDSAQRAFEAFLPYLEREMAAVQDPSLKQEADLLRKLIAL